MNRSPSSSLPLLIAITSFVNYKTAPGLSQRSVDSYKGILEQWAESAGNKKVAQFSDGYINHYLVYIRTEYIPRRFGHITRAFSKIACNIWITLCSLFTGTHIEFRFGNPMRQLQSMLTLDSQLYEAPTNAPVLEISF